MGSLRQLPQRLGKGDVFHFLHKSKDIPAGVATEAVEELPVPIHGKGRRLFAVERAAGPIGTAPFLEGNIAGNNLDNIGAVLYFLFEILKILIHGSSFVFPTLYILGL